MKIFARGLLALVFMLAVLPTGQADGQPPDILIIHSYHKGYTWTDEQSAGLESTLRARFPDVTIDVVYLDWKRHPTDQNLADMATLLRHRYAGQTVSAIATTDNAALSFALTLREDLFPDTPIVHGGILKSEVDSIVGDHRNVTGVYQTMDPRGTLELARSISGDVSKALFIRDQTDSSLAFEGRLREVASELDPPLTIETMGDLPFGDLLDQVGAVPRDQVILLGSYASDPWGMTLPLTSFVERITGRASAPVYGFYMNQLGHGIMGGSLLSGAESGRLQADLLANVRQIRTADSFPPVTRETSEKVIDHAVLDQWKQTFRQPPADVRIYGAPLDLWERYKTVLMMAGLVFLALLTLSVFLIINVLQRRAAQKALEGNVQELERSQEAIQQKEERYRLAAEAARDIIWEWDISADRRVYSGQVQELLGLAPEDLANSAAWRDRIHPEDKDAVLSALKAFLHGSEDQYRFEYRVRNGEGDYIWLESNTLVKRDETGAARLVVGRYTDITDVKNRRAELDYLAYHDALTGLPNREYLRRHVNQLAEGKDTPRFALCFIDLDNFKLVNDSCGHRVGDEVLIQATARLRDIMGEDRLVTRLGGDEFVIVITGGDLSILDELGERITKAFQIPFTADGQRFHLGCSAGVSVYPTDGEDYDALLRNADTAMYHAKEQGKGAVSKYQDHMGEAMVERIHLHNRLRDAVRSGHFEVHYQPQVLAGSGELRGAEALLRWRDPKQGLIPPDKFIPACEETGLIIDIGEWVLRDACAALKRFDAQGGPEMTIGINVSVVQLMQSDFVPKVIGIVDKAGVDPRRLELEITESVVMGAFDDCRRRLKTLRDIGFQTGLDDFGMGYSSLTYLRHLPFSTLKLDKTFIDGVSENAKDAAMVRSIIQIAGDLGLETVAEGVEHSAQATTLAETNCTWIQGYLVGKPMPETTFLEFRREWRGFREGTKV